MHLMDYLGPVLGSMVFVLLMSRVSPRARRRFNAIVVAGASACYLSGGGFGIWEIPYIVVAGCVVSYRGLDDVRFVGLAWLMHSAWDVAHHLYGNPLWPFLMSSSHGCAIFDAIIGVWFLAGAPGPWDTKEDLGRFAPRAALSGEVDA